MTGCVLFQDPLGLCTCKCCRSISYWEQRVSKPVAFASTDGTCRFSPVMAEGKENSPWKMVLTLRKPLKKWKGSHCSYTVFLSTCLSEVGFDPKLPVFKFDCLVEPMDNTQHESNRVVSAAD